MDDKLLKEAIALQKKVANQLSKKIKDNSKELDKIELGLGKKIMEAISKGDKSIIDDIHEKVEKFKKDEKLKREEDLAKDKVK